MKTDTWIEIGVVGAVAVALALLWHTNRQAGVGTGLQADMSLPGLSEGETASGVPLSLAIPGAAPVTPISTPAPPATLTIGGNTYTYAAGQPGSCGCGGTDFNEYGSDTDLANAILVLSGGTGDLPGQQ